MIKKQECLICGLQLELIFKKSFKKLFTVYTYKCPRCQKYWRHYKLIKHRIQIDVSMIGG